MNGSLSHSTDHNTTTAEYRRRVHHEADVVIVGAGILGSALAVALGNQGRSVLLLETSLKEPDRIVGELLQPGGVQALEQLGLRDCLEGIDAIPVKGYHVSYFGDAVDIQYPRLNPSAPQPEGRSFHHGRFVMKLRQAAMACSNVTVVETKATALVRCSHTEQVLGVVCETKKTLTPSTTTVTATATATRTANGYRTGDEPTNVEVVQECYFGDLTVVSDGYNSRFRKEHHPHTPRVRSKFFGLELIDAELPRPNFGHVLLSDNPPVLIYQIGTHETRILVDVPEHLPSASVKNGGVKGHLRNTVLPSLPAGVQPSFRAALENDRLRSMPNSFLPAAPNKTPGLVILGDALNMRHPLTGGGMTVALNDVVVLGELLGPDIVPNLADSHTVLKQLAKFHWRRKNGSSVINILAQALYSLFAANDRNLRALQRGCFKYFQLGMVDGPAGLLAGLIKQPFVLFSHFFSVAFVAIWLLFAENPLYMFPVVVVRSVMVFWTACVVIFPYIFAEIS